LVGVGDLGELGISDFIKNSRSDLMSPDLSKELGVSLGRHEGQVFFCNPRIAGQEELIEDLAAGSPLLRRLEAEREAPAMLSATLCADCYRQFRPGPPI